MKLWKCRESSARYYRKCKQRAKEVGNMFGAPLIAVPLLLLTLSACGDEAVPTSLESSAETVEENAAEVIPVKTVTISAAGDTTLATDVNFAGQGSFENELKRQNYSYSYFLENVADIFASDDLTILNFEGTVSERGTRADKTYAFRGKPEYLHILKDGYVEAVNLANNHSRDYGEISYKDTKESMSDYDIMSFGYDDISLYEKDGIKVGMCGITALSATSVASASKQIEKLSKSLDEREADIKIISIHWGIEGDNIYSSKQAEIGRYAVDSGFDLVLGHHPHVIQGIEEYKGKYIVYSMGNFCFGGNKNPKDKDCFIWRQTFEVTDGEAVGGNYEIIPCRISSVKDRNNYKPTPLDGAEKECVLSRIETYSNCSSD